MANAGFHHAAVIEWDHDACETFRKNQRRHNHDVEEWPLYEGECGASTTASSSGEEVVVVSGGPPCQPFSLGGKHRGHLDRRDMFPEAVRAVRELRPKAFIFENVKGLLRQKLRGPISSNSLQLTHPNLVRRKSESWCEHRARLEQSPHCAAASGRNTTCLPAAQRRQLRSATAARARVPGRLPLGSRC